MATLKLSTLITPKIAKLEAARMAQSPSVIVEGEVFFCIEILRTPFIVLKSHNDYS